MLQTVIDHQQGVRSMRAKSAAAYLGIGISTFWRWVADGRLPKGTRLSARVTVWKLEDIEQFLNQADGQAR